MSLRLRKISKKWDELHHEEENASARFASGWVNDLEDTLHRYRNDKDFIYKIIDSASRFFSESMTEQEKHDAFFFLLGKSNRRKR